VSRDAELGWHQVVGYVMVPRESPAHVFILPEAKATQFAHCIYRKGFLNV
jgi:hypothetical protein